MTEPLQLQGSYATSSALTASMYCQLTGPEQYLILPV